MRREIRVIGVLALIAMLAVSVVQSTPPVRAQDAALTTIARGLTTPGGFSWNANDVLFVALAGSGGTDTGASAIIDGGCPTALGTGIPSLRTAQGRIYGAEAIAELDGQLYLLFSNAGDPNSAVDLANGVYRIGGGGGLELVADHAAFLQGEGIATPGNPVAMVAGDDALFIADAANGLISTVVPGSDEELVADLSDQGVAPSDLALGADGSIYVSGSGDPAQPGSGSVVNIAADGSAQTIWTGLTMTSGIAIGNDGALYATELASGVSDADPNGLPGSGRLVRQAGDDGAEVVFDGLMFPSALGTGPDGAVYFVTGAIGSEDGSGTIARFAPDGSAADAAPASCAPIEETLSAAPAVTPVASEPAAETPSPTETPAEPETPTVAPTPSPTAPWTPDSAAPTGEVVDVGLTEYSIDMPTELPAGPVTFVVTNYGTLTHSLAIEGPGVNVQLSHELEPGQTGAFTVTLAPGTYAVTSPSAGDRDNGMSLVLTVS